MGMGMAASAPPMSAQLAREIAGMAPVRTRRPWRTFAVVALVSLVPAAVICTLGVLGGFGVRQPRPITHGPYDLVILRSAVWFGVYLAALAAALVPPRGQVMPDPRRARRWAVVSALLLVGASVLSAWHGASAPPSLFPKPTSVECVKDAMLCGLTPLFAGLFALRGARPQPPGGVGAALGVAAGALGGLHLSLECPVATGLAHFVVGHTGPAIVASVFGAVASAWLARRE
jgi:hypothetical protein